MLRAIACFIVLTFATTTAQAQAPAEPARIQRAVFDARPLDKKPEVPATPAVDVPIQQLGKQFRLLGKLKAPLGEVVKVQGLVVEGPGKGYEDGLNARVFRINGVATQEFIQIKLRDYYSREEIPNLEPGKTFELEGFETGGFVGVPAEALKRGGEVAQTSGHQFLHEFKVIEATEIKLQPFTPADFLGREMLVQGEAVSAEGSAYIMAGKWKLLVDNGTPWSRSTEGKIVEARGVIRTIGKTTTYRLENSGKANNARLVKLADQVGKAVTLRGTIIEKNGEWSFKYRGQVLRVEGLKALAAAAGPQAEAQVSGVLEVVRSTTTPDALTGEQETQAQYLVRKATLKPTDALLAIERAEPVE